MRDHEVVSVLGISGSLQQGSYNTAALRAAQVLAPEGMTIKTSDLAPISLYDEDVHAQGFPPSVDAFRARIKAADTALKHAAAASSGDVAMTVQGQELPAILPPVAGSGQPDGR
jgi:NADPH-dependent FMN reductase